MGILWICAVALALMRPGVQGATNWYSPSYSPQTNLFYLTVWENKGWYLKGEPNRRTAGWRTVLELPSVCPASINEVAIRRVK